MATSVATTQDTVVIRRLFTGNAVRSVRECCALSLYGYDLLVSFQSILAAGKTESLAGCASGAPLRAASPVRDDDDTKSARPQYLIRAELHVCIDAFEKARLRWYYIPWPPGVLVHLHYRLSWPKSAGLPWRPKRHTCALLGEISPYSSRSSYSSLTRVLCEEMGATACRPGACRPMLARGLQREGVFAVDTNFYVRASYNAGKSNATFVSAHFLLLHVLTTFGHVCASRRLPHSQPAAGSWARRPWALLQPFSWWP